MIEFVYAKNTLKTIMDFGRNGGFGARVEGLKEDLVDQVKVSCQGDIAVVPFFPSEDTHGVGWLLLQECDYGEVDDPVPDDGPIDLKTAKGVIIGFENARSIDVFLEALSAMQEGFEGGSRWSVFADVIDELRRRKLISAMREECEGGSRWSVFVKMIAKRALLRRFLVKVAANAVEIIDEIDAVELLRKNTKSALQPIPNDDIFREVLDDLYTMGAPSMNL